MITQANTVKIRPWPTTVAACGGTDWRKSGSRVEIIVSSCNINTRPTTCCVVEVALHGDASPPLPPRGGDGDSDI